MLIILTLLTAGLATYLRSHYRELVLDEIMYQYILKTDHYGGYWDDQGFHDKLRTVGDVLRSQADHYVYGNGRVFVHVVEQLFSGILPMESYFVLGAIFMVALIALTVRLCIPSGQRGNPAWWLATTISVMYLFPYIHRVWYSINYSCNYLIPALLCVALLLQFRHLYRQHTGTLFKVCAAFTALLFGASHEGYSIPVAGGLGLYYVFHFKELRRGWIILVPLCLGILTMLFSPGNWSRVVDIQPGYVSPIATFITHVGLGLTWVMQIPLFWVMAVILIGVRITRTVNYSELLRRDRVFLVATISLLWGLIFFFAIAAYTYAYTPITLLMLFVTLRVLAAVPSTRREPGRLGMSLCGATLVLLIVSQALIVRDSRIMAAYQHDMIQRYIASEDGVVLNDPPHLPFYTRPFVTIWPIYRNPPINDLAFSGGYSGYTKGCFMFSPDEYAVATGHASLFEQMPGGTPFVRAGRYYWAERDSLPQDVSGYEFDYYPVGFDHERAPILMRIQFALNPGKYPATESVPTDTFTFGNRTFVLIKVPDIRKARGIRAVK